MFYKKKKKKVSEIIEIKKYSLYGIDWLSSKIIDDCRFFLSVVCDVLANGVTGVFGPAAGDTAPIVQSICDYKEIPHIQTRWDINQKHGLCQINLYPHPSTLAKVVTETKHGYPVSAPKLYDKTFVTGLGRWDGDAIIKNYTWNNRSKLAFYSR